MEALTIFANGMSRAGCVTTRKKPVKALDKMFVRWKLTRNRTGETVHIFFLMNVYGLRITDGTKKTKTKYKDTNCVVCSFFFF